MNVLFWQVRAFSGFYRFQEKKNIVNNNSVQHQEIRYAKPSPANLKANFIPFGMLLKDDKREWLETNGAGSYASQTVSGFNSRGEHGLLVTSEKPAPAYRNVLLSHIIEDVEVEGRKQTFAEPAYSGQRTKKGDESGKEYSNIRSFEAEPVPTWKYDLGLGENVSLVKQVVMPHDKNHKAATVIGYKYEAPYGSPEISLSLSPLFNYRGYKDSGSNNIDFWDQSVNNKKLKLSAENRESAINVAWDNDNLEYTPWGEYKKNGEPHNGGLKQVKYNDLYYYRSSERDTGGWEGNLLKSGEFKIKLKPGETFAITVSTNNDSEAVSIDKAVEDKKAYLDHLYEKSGLPKTKNMKLLQRAADQFIVKEASGYNIEAGYHWFEPWGRDTMISLPGLTLATKRFDLAEKILTTFSDKMVNGMLPNDLGTGGFNSSDGTMYWFNALDSYIKTAGSNANKEFIRDQYDKLKQVVDFHMYGRYDGEYLLDNSGSKLRGIVDVDHPHTPVGTGKDWRDIDYGLGMDVDGLITSDNPQMTWMDAAPWGNPEGSFTPRDGKCIEINALWYNGLCMMKELAEKFGDKAEADRYDKLATVVKESMQGFWNSKEGCLYDLIDINPDKFGRDGQKTVEDSIRPNQVIAISLPHKIFTPEQEKSVLNVVTEELFDGANFGLRTLNRDNPKYAKYYPNANCAERDPVYHRGTVWTWLIGPFADAYINVNGNTKENREHVYEMLQPLLKHIAGNIPEHEESGSCIGGIAEIFDADVVPGKEYQYSKGTVNQAWSVAETLRIMAKVQDVVKEKEEAD